MIPTELLDWLAAEAQRQIAGCRRLAHDGVTPCYCPDGHGGYGALWTRDFYYMVEGCPEAFNDEEFRLALSYLVDHVRSDGTAPDRVQMDGLAVYCAGAPDNPVGLPPTDNGPFLVKLAALYYERTADDAWLDQAWLKLLRALDATPRRFDGLVWIDPEGPARSPYGFTDTVAKTGAELFASLLFWEACGCLASLAARREDRRAARAWGQEADRVRAAFGALWHDGEGVFLAASEQCRQPDVWGSAYAVYCGLATAEQAVRIGRWLNQHHAALVWHGMLRHVREPAGWQGLIRSYAAGTYQNGAFWPVPAPWLYTALARVNRPRAEADQLELVEHLKAAGCNEWETPDGRVGAREYVASATLALLAARLAS